MNFLATKKQGQKNGKNGKAKNATFQLIHFSIIQVSVACMIAIGTLLVLKIRDVSFINAVTTIAAICTVIFGFTSVFIGNKVAQKYPEWCKWLLLCAASIFFGSAGCSIISFLGVNVTTKPLPAPIEPPVISESMQDEEVSLPEDTTEEISIPDTVVANTGIDVQSPDTIVNEMKLASQNVVFQPPTPSEQLLFIVNPAVTDLGITEITSLTMQDQFCSLLADVMKKTVDTAAEPDADTINGNNIFTSLVSKANELEKDMRANGKSIELVEEMISLREEAYAIYQTKALRLLLSNSYQSLAHLYQNEGNREAVYSCYSKGIEYRAAYIERLNALDDNYYGALYTLGILYQCMGDISFLDAEYRECAYQLSSAFFEIVCKYQFENDEMNLFSSYYCAMAHHKLLALHWFNRERETQVYITEAYCYYEKSLAFTEYQKQLSYQYQYLGQVCNYAQQYIKQFGIGEHMHSQSEYAELEAQYYELSH